MDARFAGFGQEEMRKLSRSARVLARRYAAGNGVRPLHFFLDRCWDGVLEGLATYDPSRGRSLLGWLRYKMAHQLRERLAPLEASLDQAPEGVYRQEYTQAVWWEEFLATLSPGHRQLAELLAQGYTMREVAQIAGVKPMALWKRAEVLRKALKRRAV